MCIYIVYTLYIHAKIIFLFVLLITHVLEMTVVFDLTTWAARECLIYTQK